MYWNQKRGRRKVGGPFLFAGPQLGGLGREKVIDQKSMTLSADRKIVATSS